MHGDRAIGAHVGAHFSHDIDVGGFERVAANGATLSDGDGASHGDVALHGAENSDVPIAGDAAANGG